MRKQRIIKNPLQGWLQQWRVNWKGRPVLMRKPRLRRLRSYLTKFDPHFHIPFIPIPFSSFEFVCFFYLASLFLYFWELFRWFNRGGSTRCFHMPVGLHFLIIRYGNCCLSQILGKKQCNKEVNRVQKIQTRINYNPMNPKQQSSQKQLQSLITPDIKSQLDQFMKATEIPRSQNIFSSFIDQIYVALFHFGQADTRKLKRLISYTGRMDVTIDDHYLRSMYTKFNVGFLCAFAAGLIIPTGLASKSLTAMSILLIKTAITDKILFFKTITYEANNNILQDYSQQYRNILTYFYKKMIPKEENSAVRKMLSDQVHSMEQHTRKYDAFQMNKHLM